MEAYEINLLSVYPPIIPGSWNSGALCVCICIFPIIARQQSCKRIAVCVVFYAIHVIKRK